MHAPQQVPQKVGRRARVRALMCGVVVLGLAVVLPSCGPKEKKVITPPPPPGYAGPEFLRGSIGGVASLSGYRPVLVSGFGLVVGLHGTGSGDCPAPLRPLILDMISKGGFNTYQTGTKGLTPERILASTTAAVVTVEGMIPPGASRGTRFDLLVSALPSTGTTSLQDGVLYSIDLRIGGTDLSMPALSNIARGHGPIFVNPFAKNAGQAGDEHPASERIGTILGGGWVSEDLPLNLVTTEASYRLTRQIADRINSRFPPDPNDPTPIANPKSDTIVAIHIPAAFRKDPKRLLDLLSHLFLNPMSDFSEAKAKELAKLLQNPATQKYAGDIAYAWEGLGPIALGVIRPLYLSVDPVVELTALTAGARLGDLRAVEPLGEIAKADHGESSQRATALLGELLAGKPGDGRIVRALRGLLDAHDPQVRIAAYEGLANVDDGAIRRFGFKDKMELDQVACRTPMIYVTRVDKPRVIVFGDRMGFKAPGGGEPMLFTLWDNSFMLRGDSGTGHVAVFYQAPGAPTPTQCKVPDNVGYLAGVMAFEPDQDSKNPGLDMSYSRIVTALYQMTKAGVIDAPFVAQREDLLDRVTQSRNAQVAGGVRPENKNDQPELLGPPQIVPQGPTK